MYTCLKSWHLWRGAAERMGLSEGGYRRSFRVESRGLALISDTHNVARIFQRYSMLFTLLSAHEFATDRAVDLLAERASAASLKRCERAQLTWRDLTHMILNQIGRVNAVAFCPGQML